MPGMASSRGVERLTSGATSCSVDLSRNGIDASRAKCSNTPHDSDPTLSYPVNGLPRIIQPRSTLVLRGCSSPHDFFVGVGCIDSCSWKKSPSR
jgi:hypothetical protein